MVKNPPAVQETWVPSLGWEDPLEEGMATYSSIRAWTRVGHDWVTKHSKAQSMSAWMSDTYRTVLYKGESVTSV